MRRRPSLASASRCLGWALACLICIGVLVVTAAPALAHPLGNFTVNTHIGVRVEPAAVALDVVVDIAEVPTLRAFPGLDAAKAAAGDAVPEADQRAYRERMCPALRDAVGLRVGGAQVELADMGSSLSFPPGDAGLATARLECTLRSAQELDTVGQEVVLIDRMAVQPVGWREITAVGDGVELATSDVPDSSVSDVLRNYPQDLLDDPLDQRGATLSVVAGSGVVTGAVAAPGGPGSEPFRGLDPMTTAFMDLISATRLGVGVGVLAIVLALLLGSLHAVAPGHGKTLMAAYLMGREGSLRQAALIGLSVTVTHTAGVLVLGVLLSVAALTAPEQVYPWLSLASGLLLVVIGSVLVRGAWRRRSLGPDDAHAHAHAHALAHVHGHDHGPGHDHGHAHGAERPTAGATRDGAAAPGRVAVATSARAAAHPRDPHADRGSLVARRVDGVRGGHRSLLAVGFAGGLVPSPSALVVLLGGIALGRAWFGVLLVLAYGIGMALALMVAGLVVVRARDRVERWSAARRLAGGRTGGTLAVVRALPLLTAVLVVLIGVGLAVRALAQV